MTKPLKLTDGQCVRVVLDDPHSDESKLEPCVRVVLDGTLVSVTDYLEARRDRLSLPPLK